MNDRVVCVMSVGAGKYRKQYELVRDNLMAYAKKCHADFRFIDDYIDKDKKRDIYSPVSYTHLMLPTTSRV